MTSAGLRHARQTGWRRESFAQAALIGRPVSMVFDPDSELVERVARGDSNAARALMGRHLPRVLSLARRMLSSHAEAEDVAQEVFIRAWTNAAKWRPGEAKFETWLHRVAMNLCYDRLRKKPTQNLDTIADHEDACAGPAQILFQGQVSRHVDAALRAIPDRQREAIVLCHYRGMTNIAAASVMEISVEALESLLARGRRTLREKLKHLAPHLMGRV